ncbi:MAG: hypothetical protein IKZ54_07600 [Bacteroidales bacterium]|nr:hypothetical protein [Bacteroidales bacterium]
MENNVIILCPSWEDRSFLGFKQDCEDINAREVIALKKERPVNESEISTCIEKITSLCSQQAIAYEDLIWKDNPIENGESLKSRLDQLKPNDIVHIDITTMPRDIIWTLLFFLNQRSNRVLIRYYEPESYHDTWLSKEPYSPRLLLKHSGIIELGKPQCVVIITGFDEERTRQIVSKFEPQKVVLCVQRGKQHNNDKRNVSSRHESICRSVGVSDISSMEIDCYETDFGTAAIDTVLSSLSDYNIILASFGPKPSAIGVYKAYQTHKEIALCYVPCREYNKEYCNGIGKLYSMIYNE